MVKCFSVTICYFLSADKELNEISPTKQEQTLSNENQDASTDSKQLENLSLNENKEQRPTSANEKLEATQPTNQESEREKSEGEDLEVIEISDHKVEKVSVEDETKEKTVKNAWSDSGTACFYYLQAESL